MLGYVSTDQELSLLAILSIDKGLSMLGYVSTDQELSLLAILSIDKGFVYAGNPVN
jgi:hypothetical protein